jgi:hypothetical protein
MSGSVSHLRNVIFFIEFNVRSKCGFKIVTAHHPSTLCESMDQFDTFCISASIEFLSLECSRNTSIKRVIFAPDSKRREVRKADFESCTIHESISLPASVEIIHVFVRCPSLRELQFDHSNCLGEIRGFVECESLSRIDIPLFDEIFTELAFSGCSGLTEMAFVSDSQVREIHGFEGCSSLYQIDIP